MKWGEMSLGWAGWVEERVHGLCMHFLLLCFPSQEKLEMIIASEGVRESQSEEVNSKWLKGGSLV